MLKANQVTPTSHLLDALWPNEELPASARKMLQNAVWSLRAVLGVAEGPGAPRLSTQAPGYVLHVDPEQVDLFQFHRKAAQGRAELTAGEPEKAARMLRDALGIWRGDPLSDLVESGITWPALTAVANARLDVMEDYFEAELACGRHQSVLPELEALLESEHLRERACGQLMLALYRCGRHADALNVYSRLRTRLVEDLGLEPGPALQKLQQAILTHDPSLALPEPRTITPTGVAVPERRMPVDVPQRTVARDPLPQHQHVTMMLVQARLRSEWAEPTADPEELDHVLATMTSMVHAGIEELGGTVATSIGSASLAVFGYPSAQGDQELEAVRAALALRECFTSSRMVVHIALVTGNALVVPPPTGCPGPPTISGTLVDRTRQLLSFVPEDEVWICERTRTLVGDALVCAPADAGTWRVERARPDRAGAAQPASDLVLVRSLLERTVQRDTPHLVTVFGEPDEAMRSFMTGIECCVSEELTGTRLFTGVASESSPLGAAAAVLAAYCGIDGNDCAESARHKLLAVCRRLCHNVRQADRQATRLMPLLCPEQQLGPAAAKAALTAWRWVLELAARHQPMVVELRDLHLACDELLDAVELLVDPGPPAALLVVVSARLSLLDRRPDWGGGKQHAASITLTAPANGPAERLRRVILSTIGGLDPAGLPIATNTLTPVKTRPEHRQVVRLHCQAPVEAFTFDERPEVNRVASVLKNLSGVGAVTGAPHFRHPADPAIDTDLIDSAVN